MTKKKATRAKTARGVKNLPVKRLTAKQARDVKGGRKAGKGQQEYLIIKMNDVIVS